MCYLIDYLNEMLELKIISSTLFYKKTEKLEYSVNIGDIDGHLVGFTQKCVSNLDFLFTFMSWTT